MNRWLYRTAGTVGVAGGFLLLGAASAQADQTESVDALIGDVFSPTSGLPPLNLPVAPEPMPDPAGAADRATASGPGTLTLDPDDGRSSPAATTPEVLPGLPLGGLDSVPGSLPLGGGVLDRTGLSDANVGIGAPLDDLIRLDGNLVGLPGQAADDGFRIHSAGQLPRSEDRAEIIGPMPFVTQPVTDALLAGRSLGDLVTLGDLAGQVPVAGPMVSQTAGTLPLVGDVAPGADRGTSLDGGTSPDRRPGPVAGSQVPAVIADELAAERGLAPELGDPAAPTELTGGLPLIGPALEPIGQMVGVGNLAGQLPLVGPLAGQVTGGLPVVDPPTGSEPGAGGPDPAAAGPDPARAGERPIAGDDPEFAGPTGPTESTESTEFLPLGQVGGLTRQLPVPPPLALVRSLPIVGGLAGQLPG